MKTINNIKAASLLFLLALFIQSCIKDYDNPASGTPGEYITIYALNQRYLGNEITLNGETMGGASKIQAVVISDKTGLNLEPGTFVVQNTFASANTTTDITRGLILKMAGGTPEYNFGDSLLIKLDGTKLNRINGKLTITGLTTDKITVAATNKIPLLRYVNFGILDQYMDQYESTLISLNADVADYATGTTYSGLKKLKDNTGSEIYVETRPEATFAGTQVAIDAQFTGIAGYYNENGKELAGAKKTIRPRNAGDIQFLSGAIYTGFPESFETPDVAVKSSYNSGTNLITTGTGSWFLLQAILANTLTSLSDKVNPPGKQAIRMQQNLTTSGYVQMNFDVPDGAGKVSVFYGKYGTDAKSSFRLEYSTNQGTTWTPVGANITDMPEKGNKQITWAVNITGPVRFRINKLGIGATNNGRLSLDDFVVYKK